jgi:hypothetical protein
MFDFWKYLQNLISYGTKTKTSFSPPCFEVSKSHTRTHTHTRYDSSGWVIGPSQRSLPTQQTQQINIYSVSGVLFFCFCIVLYCLCASSILCFLILIVLHFAFSLYLQHKRWTSVLPAGSEPGIAAIERPQTHALDRSATGNIEPGI